MVEISKRDWKLFREKLPGWQESYMERLCTEYVELLTSNQKGSTRFWALEERIKKDRKAPGVINPSCEDGPEGCSVCDCNSFTDSACHSDADIFSFDEGSIQQIRYEDTESYQITKMFLDNREYMLKRLLAEDDDE